jgi:hypothetical protein
MNFNTTTLQAPRFNISVWASAQAVCEPRVADVSVLGYFLDNELSCPPVPAVALNTFLAMSPDTHGYATARTFLGAKGYPVEAKIGVGPAERAADAVEGGAAALPSLHSAPLAIATEFAQLVVRQYFNLTTAAIRHYDARCSCCRTENNQLSRTIVQSYTAGCWMTECWLQQVQ